MATSVPSRRWCLPGHLRWRKVGLGRLDQERTHAEKFNANRLHRVVNAVGKKVWISLSGFLVGTRAHRCSWWGNGVPILRLTATSGRSRKWESTARGLHNLNHEGACHPCRARTSTAEKREGDGNDTAGRREMQRGGPQRNPVGGTA